MDRRALATVFEIYLSSNMYLGNNDNIVVIVSFYFHNIQVNRSLLTKTEICNKFEYFSAYLNNKAFSEFN